MHKLSIPLDMKSPGDNDMNFGLAIIDINHFKHINDG